MIHTAKTGYNNLEIPDQTYRLSMYDFFISYSRENIELMKQIVAALRSDGLAIWVDELLAPGDDSWQNRIEEGIELSRALIALMSPTFKTSQWCEKELVYARTYKKPIFPLLIKGDITTSIPFELINMQYADARIDLTMSLYMTLENYCKIFQLLPTPLMIQVQQEQIEAKLRFDEEKKCLQDEEVQKRVQAQLELLKKSESEWENDNQKALGYCFHFTFSDLIHNRKSQLSESQSYRFYGSSRFVWGKLRREKYILPREHGIDYKVECHTTAVTDFKITIEKDKKTSRRHDSGFKLSILDPFYGDTVFSFTGNWEIMKLYRRLENLKELNKFPLTTSKNEIRSFPEYQEIKSLGLLQDIWFSFNANAQSKKQREQAIYSATVKAILFSVYDLYFLVDANGTRRFLCIDKSTDSAGYMSRMINGKNGESR